MMRLLGRNIAAFAFLTCATVTTCASEADINIPDLSAVKFGGPGGISGLTLMYLGIVICAIGAVFGLLQYRQTKALPVHESMGRVSNTIWETCKTYLIQQGKFLLMLFVLIACAITFYLLGFGHSAEYELTDREIQELRIEKVPDEPCPHRPLVVCRVSRPQIAEIRPLVIPMPRIEASQSHRREQLDRDRVNHRLPQRPGQNRKTQ